MIQFLENPVIRWMVLLGYIALVYFLCLLPSSDMPHNSFLDKIYYDKWVHAMMYFGVWTLCVWKMKGSGALTQNREKFFIISFVIVLIMGASIEFLQALTDRSMDWKDVMANLLGAFIAYRFWLRFEHRWKVYSW